MSWEVGGRGGGSEGCPTRERRKDFPWPCYPPLGLLNVWAALRVTVNPIHSEPPICGHKKSKYSRKRRKLHWI